MATATKPVADAVQSLRDQIKNRCMEIEFLILFTEFPPDGEEYFTICAEKSIEDLPEEIRGDKVISQDDRKVTYNLTHRISKDETTTAESCIFSRVQKGKKVLLQKYLHFTYFCKI